MVNAFIGNDLQRSFNLGQSINLDTEALAISLLNTGANNILTANSNIILDPSGMLFYDNTGSGLLATTVQDAVDEIVSAGFVNFWQKVGALVSLAIPTDSVSIDGSTFYVDTPTSRVGIGTTTPILSSILDITSTTEGILIPRMSTVQRDAIATPSTGLFVFNIDNSRFEFYDGAVWQTLDTSLGNDLQSAYDQGNTIVTVAGVPVSITAPTASDNAFVVNVGQVGIGTITPTYKLEVVDDTGVTLGEHQVAAIYGSSASGLLFGYIADGAIRTSGFMRSPSGYDLTLGAGTSFDDAIFIDKDNGFVGIGGVATPLSALHVDTGSSSVVIADRYFTGISSPGFVSRHARGTSALPTALLSGDYLGTSGGRGYDGTAFSPLSNSLVGFRATENFSATNHGSGITFETTDNGSIIRTVKMFLDDEGSLGIGTITPDASSILDLTSTTQGLLTPRLTQAQRDAISSPTTGLLIYNTDTDSFNYFDGVTWETVGGSLQDAYDNGNTISTTLGVPVTIDGATENDPTLVLPNGFVGIGTVTPTSFLHIVDDTVGSYGTVNLFRYKSTANGNGLGGSHARGTEALPTAVLANDQLFGIGGNGYDGASFPSPSKSGISFNASENWSVGSNGTYINFQTTDNGSTSRTEKARITDDGALAVGTTTPDASAILQLESTARGFLSPRLTTAERNAIVSPATGLMIYNTSTDTFDYYDGVSWVSLDSANDSLQKSYDGGNTITTAGALPVDITVPDTSNNFVLILTQNDVTNNPTALRISNNGTGRSIDIGGIAGSLDISGDNWNVTYEGDITGTSLTATDLTSGRVPYVSTGGLLLDDAGLLYDAASNALRVGVTTTLTNGNAIYSGIFYAQSISTTATLGSTSIEYTPSDVGILRVTNDSGVLFPDFELRLTDAGFGSHLIAMSVSQTEIVMNESGVDRNFRVESDTDANMIFVDAGNSNIGISTATPDTSAKLDITSTTQGFLPPRMTDVERDAIASPAAGLMIFDTVTSQWEGYNGTAWVIIG